MKGYSADIEKLSLENTDFRRVLYTAKNCQLVLMSLLPGEDIGEEVHDLDQFIRCEAGNGIAIVNGEKHPMSNGTIILVPSGAMHNIINGSESDMKLYTLYAPPNHKDGTIHTTKAEAEANEEHFDGATTE